ncbi:MAG: ACT domain-containing protein [Archangium sp.]
MRDLPTLLRSLQAQRQPGVYVFALAPPGVDVSALQPISTFRETEGLSVIVDEATAQRYGLVPLFRAAWLTLSVHSDLAAVGLTAAVAGALARQGIACNVVAAAHHDHLFVAVDAADAALATLAELQREAQS